MAYPPRPQINEDYLVVFTVTHAEEKDRESTFAIPIRAVDFVSANRIASDLLVAVKAAGNPVDRFTVGRRPASSSFRRTIKGSDRR